MANAGKARLLVLASTYPRWEGDYEPGFVHHLCNELTRNFDVHVICPHAKGALANERIANVQIHRFRYAPTILESLVHNGGIVNNLKFHPWKWLLLPPFLLALVVKTAFLVSKLRPSCVHAHWIVPQGLAFVLASLFIRRFPPFLLTSHGGDLYGLRGSAVSFLKQAVVKRSSAMTVVSSPMVQLALNLGVKPEKLKVIPMGVDFDGLFCPDDTVVRNRSEILFVGRLVEKKGLKYLVDAMPEIKSKIPNVQLTIAGFGPEELALRQRVSQLGLEQTIIFLGAMPQSALPALYRRASVFVAPFIQADSGDQDGLPVALMEAIACGCPVLVGDLPAMNDLFEATETDLRIAHSEFHSIGKRILDILTNPANANLRADQIRLRLTERLNWHTISNEYAVLLEKIMANSERIIVEHG